MTNTQPTPAPERPQAAPAPQPEVVAEKAMVPSPESPKEDVANNDPIPPESAVARLPVELDVCVPVREFRVKNLLALDSGVIIESQWSHGDDVPLTSGEVQLAWSEFEVVDTQLAVRVTRLA